MARLIPSVTTRRPIPAILALVFTAGLPTDLIQARPGPTFTASCVLRFDLSHPRCNATDAFRQTELKRLGSKEFLQAVLRKPDVAGRRMLRTQPDPLAYLRSILRADFDTGPQFLTIRVTGSDSDELVVLIRAVARTVAEAHQYEVGTPDQIVNPDEHVQELQKRIPDIEARIKALRVALRPSVFESDRDVKRLREELTRVQRTIAERTLPLVRVAEGDPDR